MDETKERYVLVGKGEEWIFIYGLERVICSTIYIRTGIM